MDLGRFVRDVPDFPKNGIIFKDITPLLADPAALDEAVRQLAAPYEGKGVQAVAAIESRGFIFGAAVAQRLRAGFVPLRKPGKLPRRTVRAEYELEYGTDAIEMHADAIRPGTKVLMLDDLLATGGTMAAACRLVERLGGRVVGIAFLIDLAFLKGRDKLGDRKILALVTYDAE